MRSRFLGILFAATVLGGPFVAPVTASARDSFAIMFNTGDVDIAYRDGWWDHHHHFHHWRHGERGWYQTHYRRAYRDWDHDRDRDHDRYHRDRDWDGHY